MRGRPRKQTVPTGQTIRASRRFWRLADSQSQSVLW